MRNDTSSPLARTDARVRILPGLRHMAPVEGAAAVNAALLEFLREIR